jgi:hypothetical protein
MIGNENFFYLFTLYLNEIPESKKPIHIGMGFTYKYNLTAVHLPSTNSHKRYLSS